MGIKWQRCHENSECSCSELFPDSVFILPFSFIGISLVHIWFYLIMYAVLWWMEAVVYHSHKMAQRAPMEGFPMNHCYIKLH